jgi:hypothetical protein
MIPAYRESEHATFRSSQLPRIPAMLAMRVSVRLARLAILFLFADDDHGEK